MQNLVIDAERLWDELLETAQIGATPKGGICRLTLTDLDREVRDWFRARCEALGCAVRSEEHTSELQSRTVISYAVFCLKKKKNKKQERTVENTTTINT